MFFRSSKRLLGGRCLDTFFNAACLKNGNFGNNNNVMINKLGGKNNEKT